MHVEWEYRGLSTGFIVYQVYMANQVIDCIDQANIDYLGLLSSSTKWYSKALFPTAKQLMKINCEEVSAAFLQSV